jgi:hypothetical protein
MPNQLKLDWGLFVDILKNLKIMWILKNSNEYCVFAPNRKKAIEKFKTQLGMIVSGRMIIYVKV